MTDNTHDEHEDDGQDPGDKVRDEVNSQSEDDSLVETQESTADHPPRHGDPSSSDNANEPDSAAVASDATSNEPDEALSLDELQAAIQAQLKDLISDAKVCRDKAIDLLKRAKPFQAVRDELQSIIDEDQAHIQAIHQAHEEVIDQRVEKIRKVSGGFKREIEVRSEAVAGRKLAVGNQMRTNGVTAKTWVLAVQQRQAEIQGAMNETREWLAGMEQRWGDEEMTEIEEV